MAAPAPSWNLVRVFGTWRNLADGALKAGTYTIRVVTRVTNSTDDAIIPSGVFATGALSTSGGGPSLSVLTPCTDDPDNAQVAKVEVKVEFADGSTPERYVLDVPYANRPTADGGNDAGVNLRTAVLADPTTPDPTGAWKVGVANGLARLNAAGQVVDASGTPVTGGGGGGSPGADGASAYEIAQQNGFAGTQEQWLASLKGEKGDPGAQGDPGGPGPKGDPGAAMGVLFAAGGVYPPRPSEAAQVWAVADTAVRPPDDRAGDLLLVWDSSSSL